MSEQEKNEIDAMTYEELLRNWRFAPSGSRLFEGDVGRYYQARMKELEPDQVERVRISKKLGWKNGN